MENFLFLFFSALTLLGALGVVLGRNAVAGVMSMIVAFLGISGLFLLLEAYLLAVLQVFVYAGAVMVLFLFVVMLLNIEEQSPKKIDPLTAIFSTLGAALIGSVLTYFFLFSPEAELLNFFAAGRSRATYCRCPVRVLHRCKSLWV